ncbi:unnamed protein product [Phytomonas sp. EM1]|nr:unnamed protein product [Phytomonas sp. EM1]|eukprot:CCW61538.1 unnamed protein product [Phytomonas sp. isolate EM1]
MPSWTCSRDEYPQSVHALMSLWGGFAPLTEVSDSGLEKRLEVDFKFPCPIGKLTVADIEALMRNVDEYLENYSCEGDFQSFTFSQTLIVLTSKMLMMSSNSTVMLHHVLKPLLDLLNQRSVLVEWMSFSRRNTTAPWSTQCETSDIMAQEYAELKAAFPTGQSFLLGPVDSEHYFFFTFDAIDRSEGNAVEQDVQINVFLYDIVRDEDDELAPNVGLTRKNTQQLTHLEGNTYEIMRTFDDISYISFETNARVAMESPARLESLLKKYKPSKIVMFALQDRNIEPGMLCRTYATLPGYALQSSLTNHFREGYSFYQLTFVCGDE